MILMGTNLSKLAVPFANNRLQPFMLEHVIGFVCKASLEAGMTQGLIISSDLIILLIQLLVLKPTVEIRHDPTQKASCQGIKSLSFEIYTTLTIISSFVFTAREQNYFDMIAQQL
jgi:hypothetical protein